MGKRSTSRFIRRVRKDISGIKARYQKKQCPTKNKELDRFNKACQKQVIPNFSLLKLIISMKLTGYL